MKIVEQLFFECAVRATLMVGVTAILLYAMRVKEAATKHRFWVGVMVFSSMNAEGVPKLLLR